MINHLFRVIHTISPTITRSQQYTTKCTRSLKIVLLGQLWGWHRSVPRRSPTTILVAPSSCRSTHEEIGQACSQSPLTSVLSRYGCSLARSTSPVAQPQTAALSAWIPGLSHVLCFAELRGWEEGNPVAVARLVFMSGKYRNPHWHSCTVRMRSWSHRVLIISIFSALCSIDSEGQKLRTNDGLASV